MRKFLKLLRKKRRRYRLRFPWKRKLNKRNFQLNKILKLKVPNQNKHLPNLMNLSHN